MSDRKDDELGVLARRRIEAAVIAPIYDEMREAIGQATCARGPRAAPSAGRRSTSGAEMAGRAPGGAEPRKLQGDPAPVDEGRRAHDRGASPDAPGVLDFNVTTLPLRRDLPRHGPGRRSATSCPATIATAPSAKGYSPTHHAGPHADHHGRRKPLRLPLPLQPAAAELSRHSWTGQRIEIVHHKRRGPPWTASPRRTKERSALNRFPAHPCFRMSARPAAVKLAREKSFVFHSVIKSATSCVQARRGK